MYFFEIYTRHSIVDSLAEWLKTFHQLLASVVGRASNSPITMVAIILFVKMKYFCMLPAMKTYKLITEFNKTYPEIFKS